MQSAGEEGYTLLEVLVAFVILAGAVIMSFRIFGDGLHRLNAADRQIQMVAAAQDLMSQLQLATTLKPGTTSGVAGDFAWTVTLTPYPGNTSSPQSISLVHARVEIRPDDLAEAASYSLETNLLAVVE